MDRDRTRFCERPARRARRPPRQELHQRSLRPQHVRCLARLHGQRSRGSNAGGRTKRQRPGGSAMTVDTRPAVAAGQAKAAPLDAETCTAFLMHEARLLDESRFHEWLALFTPDAWY